MSITMDNAFVPVSPTFNFMMEHFIYKKQNFVGEAMDTESGRFLQRQNQGTVF